MISLKSLPAFNNICSPPKDFPEELSGSAKPRKMTEAMKYCNEILRELFNKKHSAYAWPFYKPVDADQLGTALTKQIPRALPSKFLLSPFQHFMHNDTYVHLHQRAELSEFGCRNLELCDLVKVCMQLKKETTKILLHSLRELSR